MHRDFSSRLWNRSNVNYSRIHQGYIVLQIITSACMNITHALFSHYVIGNTFDLSKREYLIDIFLRVRISITRLNKMIFSVFIPHSHWPKHIMVRLYFFMIWIVPMLNMLITFCSSSSKWMTIRYWSSKFLPTIQITQCAFSASTTSILMYSARRWV